MAIYDNFFSFDLVGGVGSTRTECPVGRERSGGATWPVCMCAAGAGPGS